MLFDFFCDNLVMFGFSCIVKYARSRRKLSHKIRQNISALSLVLAQVSFTTSETEVDYYKEKVNVRVVSRVEVRRKI